jgi:hypothetical protein
MEWATAITARCFPRRAARRRKSVATEVSLICVALWANGPSPVRSARFPLRVFPERRFPALSSWPGATPAHAARRAAVPKRLIAGPISATIISAPRRSTPGMVSSRVIAGSVAHVTPARFQRCTPSVPHTERERNHPDGQLHGGACSQGEEEAEHKGCSPATPSVSVTYVRQGAERSALHHRHGVCYTGYDHTCGARV